MCVTKINKHSPSLAMSAPTVKVVQSLAFVPHALLSSLSLPPLLLLSTGNLPPPQQEAMLSQCAWKAKAISIVEAMFTFWVFILISSSQAGGQGANAQIAWGQSAEWLGQGWCFHTQCHAPKKPPATKKGKQGGPLLIQDHGFQKWFLNICHWSFWESRKGILKIAFANDA